MFAHFGRLLTVLLKFSTMSPEQMLARVEFEGEDRVRAAHAEGRGVLLFTGHFGFWEINALVHALEIEPMAVLARPLDNPLLHHLLESVRRRTGNSVIYRRGAIRRVLRALADNQAVAILIDQHIQSADAVYVDFFNRPAATTSALAALALRTGAPVVPVFALPQPGRAVPDGLRARGRAAADRRARRHPRLHAALHRRARDVCPALSGSLAVDASPLAGRRRGGEGEGHVPARERGRTIEPRSAVRGFAGLADPRRGIRGAGSVLGRRSAQSRRRGFRLQAEEIRRLLVTRDIGRLVIRAPNPLGDAIMALPAMAALRAAFPDAQLIVAAAPAVAPLFQEITQRRAGSGGGGRQAPRSRAAA